MKANMKLEIVGVLQQLSNDLGEFVRELIDKAKFNKTYTAIILSKDDKGNYRVRILQRDYTATSYFDIPVGGQVYAIAPNNDFNKIFLIPFRK